MKYAETGINLEVNLSRGSIKKEESAPKLTELHLGGLGIQSKILWDRVPPDVEPFSPDNILIFGTGILVGTPVPTANRTCVTTISPPTYLAANPVMGGYWGPELKRAGYDRVIINGKSPSLVYLWINDDKVEIRDATHLQGKGTGETQELIKQELEDERVQVAAIGLAGENRCYMASIEHDCSSASKGAGVIMGDKRLKAIAVRGTKDIYVAKPAELLEFCNDIWKRARGEERISLGHERHLLLEERLGREDRDESWHLENFSWGNARELRRNTWNKERQKLHAAMEKEYGFAYRGCHNCPNQCTLEVAYPGIHKYFLKCFTRHSYMMAAYKELDFSFKLAGIGAAYGFDGIATPQVIAMAIELYEAGILTDEDMPGFPSETGERFEWLIHKIANRDGIGDILADGTYWAARRIGNGAEAYEHCTIKKYEQQPTKRGKLNPVFYLMHCTGEKLSVPQVEGSFPQSPIPDREMREEWVKNWVQPPDDKFKQYYLNWEQRTDMGVKESCNIVEWNENMRYIDDAIGTCAFWGGHSGMFFVNVPYHIHSIPIAVSAATGMDIDEDRIWEIGKRNRTLLRGINIRLGLKREDEEAPGDHWKYRDAKLENDLKEAYYKHRGWNNEGIPTRETLVRMGLDYIAEDLEQRGILTS